MFKGRKLLILISVFILTSAISTSANAQDTFIKAGYSFFKEEDFKNLNSFIISFAQEYQIIKYMSLGYESQISYKRYSEQHHMLFNEYFIIKGIVPLKQISPFFGVGFGLQQVVSFNGGSEGKIALGYQLAAGLTMRIKPNIKFLVEFQYKKPYGDMKHMNSLAILGGIIF